MTLDEAIKYCEDMAILSHKGSGNTECEHNHRQLAEWLRDYKRLLEKELCSDAVSRQAVLDDLEKSHMTSGVRNQDTWNECIDSMMRTVRSMPPVNPQEPKTGHCKDCKWWKDSDGVYRRGVRAESKCPINNVSVNHGLGYCYMFEPQAESEG